MARLLAALLVGSAALAACGNSSEVSQVKAIIEKSNTPHGLIEDPPKFARRFAAIHFERQHLRRYRHRSFLPTGTVRS